MSQDVPQSVAVWFEIPVTDMERGKAFYATVLKTELEDQNDGPNPMANFRGGPTSVAGHLYPGKPSSDGRGPTIHLAVDDLEAGLERVTAAGGKVLSPVITIPQGRFAYCTDPDGNSFGLFAA